MQRISILFEDDEILLINKQSGIPVQGGKGISFSIDEGLSSQLGYKIHLVHRLDRETEGILIAAKNPAAASKWTKLIQSHQVQKEYTALCIGLPLVNGKPLQKGTLTGTVEAHGRTQEASLDFAVEGTRTVSYQEEKISISRIRITLGTGRMHQIRIQLSQANAPIIADDKHGDFKANKLLKKAGYKKLCLAATKLTIPLHGKPTVFTIPLPPHMHWDEEGKENAF